MGPYEKPVLSRHRLPTAYRISLTALWLCPPVLLIGMLMLHHGLSPLLADLRLAAPLLVMSLPALYIWREGIDVLPGGIIRRTHLPRYYAYSQLDAWYFDQREAQRTLTIWQTKQRKAAEYRGAHLTNLHALLLALKQNLPRRPWPY